MIVRRPEVERMTGLSRASIYRMMSAGEFSVADQARHASDRVAGR